MKKLLLFLLVIINTSSFSNSAVVLDFYLSDFCYRQDGVQERNDRFYFPNEEEGITAFSICVYKDKLNQYFSKGHLKNGNQDGKWIWYFENGQRAMEVIFKDGQGGDSFFWNKNGQMSSKKRIMREDGNEKLWTHWYENGQKKSESYWKDGQLNGIRTEWNYDGTQKFVSNWENGDCIGGALQISGDCSN